MAHKEVPNVRPCKYVLNTTMNIVQSAGLATVRMGAACACVHMFVCVCVVGGRGAGLRFA